MGVLAIKHKDHINEDTRVTAVVTNTKHIRQNCIVNAMEGSLHNSAIIHMITRYILTLEDIIKDIHFKSSVGGSELVARDCRDLHQTFSLFAYRVVVIAASINEPLLKFK